MLESRIQKLIKDYATCNGWLVRKIETPGNVGAPDLMLLRDGCAFFIEVKQAGKKPRPAQLSEHERYRSHGFRVVVASSVDDVKIFLK